MAYDERDRDEVYSLVTDDFITNVYLEFPARTYNMGSIVEDDYAVKAEKWVFAFEQNKIKSVKIVPESTQFFERYTVFPGKEDP